MDKDPSWQHFTRDGRWVCPYCLTAVRSPQQGKSALVRAVDRHLSNRCPGYQAGRGDNKPDNEIAAKVQFEDIAHFAVTDPAWQVFDHEGYWYSPSTLRKVESVRIQNRRFDGFTIQRMAGHMAQCGSYQAGQIHDAATVQRARDNGIRVSKLAANIRRLMSHTIWRYKDDTSCWVCPYCLDHVKSVIVQRESDWPDMTESMAAHLLNDCGSFSPKSQVMRREDEVASAAGMSPPSAIALPTEGTSPTLPPLSSSTTPTPSHGYQRMATPLSGSQPIFGTPPSGVQPLETPSGYAPIAALVATTTPGPATRRSPRPCLMSQATPRRCHQ
jgi:hypothetical protein